MGSRDPPDRSERQRCWDARDAFYACLAQHGIEDSSREGERAASVCARQTRDLDAVCAASWVVYFKQKHAAELKKQRALDRLRAEGAREIGMSSRPRSSGE
jgi:cytochrome c oxidase assembly factor 6